METEDDEVIPETQFNDEELRDLGFLTAEEYFVCYHNLWNNISFGCSVLDKITGGGIQTSGITEISGESGCGKTQICMQLSLNVQLPEKLGGIEKGAIYICTEHQFPTERLIQMIEFIQEKHSEISNHKFLDNIHIQHIYGWKKLIYSIENQLETILKTNNIGIIIIDSIAGVFRATELPFTERGFIMRNMIGKLIDLSIKYECAVLCINQVSSVLQAGKSILLPALGLAWANLINTRIILSKNCTEYNFDESMKNVRKFEIEFSPYLKSENCFFRITRNGIENA